MSTRDNTERDHQFTQEVRFASVAPARTSGAITLKWQAGAFFLTQHYTQDAVNNLAPGVLSPFLLFPISQHSPQATLDEFYPNANSPCYINGKLLCMRNDIAHDVVWYDKPLMESLGAKVPTPFSVVK